MIRTVRKRIWVSCCGLGLLAAACGPTTRTSIPVRPDESDWPESFGLGRPADETRLMAWDISIKPDGTGLPEGKGYAKEGALLFQVKCASCHGTKGYDGPFDPLVSAPQSKAKTIGNYWPYATTVFDYIRRAMPQNAPGSLQDQEVYQLTAFLLYANGLIEENQEINAEILPRVVMPAQSLFVPDDRKGGREIR